MPRLLAPDNPLRIRSFRNQFTAQTASLLGSSLTPVAVTLGLLRETGSAGFAGFVLAAFTTGLLSTVLVGGVLADRFRRDRLMLYCDLVRFVTQAVFGGLFLTDHLVLPVLIGLQLVSGAATGLYGPAAAGLTSETAPPQGRQRANALLAISRDGSNIGGPLLATIAVVTIGAGWALLVDALTYLISAYFLSRVDVPNRKRQSETGYWADLTDGWRAITTRTWIWSSIVGYFLFNITSAALLILGPLQLAGSTSGLLGWGAVMAMMAVGEVVGSAVALRLQPMRKLMVSKLVMALLAPLPLLIALQAPLPAIAASAALAGFALTFPDALWLTALQNHVPPDLVSRVMSFDWAGTILLRPIVLASAAGVATAIGTGVSLQLCAGLALLGALGSLVFPSVRRLGEPETPSAADSEPAMAARTEG